MRTLLLLRPLAAALAVLFLPALRPCRAAEPPPAAPAAAVRRQLLDERPVAGQPGLLTQLWLIEYAPGASAPPHRHPVAGIGYVVEGAFDSSFSGQPPLHVSAGQSFFDPPQLQHRVFRNASSERPLKFVIAYTIPRGSPIVEFTRAVHLGVSEAPISVASAALYPETLEVNPLNQKFLLSSVREGAVYEVGLDGTARRLVQDQRLSSVLGIAVDVRHGRLLVTNSDLGASVRRSPQGPKRTAAVASYDLATGRPLQYVDLSTLLPGDHLINGISVDAEGNAYATDSLTPAIYRIERGGTASVLLQSEEFRGDGVNLNGIVYHPKGYLLTVKKSTGALYRIPLAAPERFARVQVPGNFTGGDGLLLSGDDQLVVIANRTPAHKSEKAFVLKSTDDWASAKLVDSIALGDSYPTTCAALGNKLYALSSHLHEWLSAADGARPALVERGRRAEIRQIGVIDP
jgi:quercetin dioxygenase-like cupin family protein/sugar lactone lactonase YvrE